MLDEIAISFVAGAGGDGFVSFRRERYVASGGPDGGDGGDGGEIVLIADPGVLVLDDLRRRKTIRANPGAPGRPSKSHGKDGADVVVKVPVGTLVHRTDGGEPLADLVRPWMRVVVAQGGQGGKGNARFKNSIRRSPHLAERGLPGEQITLRLELRLLAEVGLVGLPNAGKSSLLRAISQARPKVGAYPFTTLEPNLGVVETGYDSMVVADIPGLIEGAHEGAGLGIAFLRHIERTVVLVHVVDVSGEDPMRDIDVVREEMAAFGHGLTDKPWMLALNKIDVPGARERAAELVHELRARRIEGYAISAATGEGTDEVVEGLFDRVRKIRADRPAAEEVILRPRPVETFSVKKADGVFAVGGERPKQVLQKLGLDSDEARIEADRRLRRMGVVKALERAGVRSGDRVRIGEAEFEWPL
jgi:GTP-binding protein